MSVLMPISLHREIWLGYALLPVEATHVSHAPLALIGKTIKQQGEHLIPPNRIHDAHFIKSHGLSHVLYQRDRSSSTCSVLLFHSYNLNGPAADTEGLGRCILLSQDIFTLFISVHTTTDSFVKGLVDCRVKTR